MDSFFFQKTKLDSALCDQLKKVEGVYFVSNQHMPGLYKVGFSRGVGERLRKAKNAFTPGQFDLVFYIACKNPRPIEKYIHRALASSRIQGSEFFRTTEAELRDVACSVFAELRGVSIDRRYKFQIWASYKDSIDIFDETFRCIRCEDTEVAITLTCAECAEIIPDITTQDELLTVLASESAGVFPESLKCSCGGKDYDLAQDDTLCCYCSYVSEKLIHN